MSRDGSGPMPTAQPFDGALRHCTANGWTRLGRCVSLPKGCACISASQMDSIEVGSMSDSNYREGSGAATCAQRLNANVSFWDNNTIVCCPHSLTLAFQRIIQVEMNCSQRAQSRCLNPRADQGCHFVAARPISPALSTDARIRY